MTPAGASPHEIFALASCSAWVRSTCPGSLTPPRDGAGRVAGDAGLAGAIDGAAVAGRNRAAPTGTAATGACAARLWAMTESAAEVPSAPQTGHATAPGMRPLTGSTSNV